LLVEPTGVCFNECWFCDVCSDLNGEHLPLKDAVAFFGILGRMQEERHLKIQGVEFIGGGDGLECPRLGRMVSEGLKLRPESSCIVTAGPNNPIGASRLETVLTAHPELALSLSVDPESESSLRRLSYALNVSPATWTSVRARISPDLKHREAVSLYRETDKIIQSVGFWRIQPETYVPPSITPVVGRRDIFRNGNRVLILKGAHITPQGRALKRLANYMLPLDFDHCTMLENPNRIVVGWDGMISPCCYGRRTRYPMTHEGVVRLLVEHDERCREVRSALAANQGKLIHNLCEVCPYN
jgi:hypothetical protein